MTPPLVELRQLSKSYGGVHALRDVDLTIAPGEVHAICGENGAGKSTLIKLLTGVVSPDHGDILVGDRRLTTGDVHAAEAAGIAVMHQESTAFPDLGAIDNLFVGREPTRWGGWWLDRRAMRQRTSELLTRLGEQFDIDRPVGELSLAQRQIVALARALSRDCRLLIMDEPTASLSARETRALLNIVRQLRRDGVSVLYVSHRLEEIFEIADRVTVLRDGQHVATHAVSELDQARLIRLMVGRELEGLTRRRTRSPETTPAQTTGAPVVLDVAQLTRRGVFADISFQVRAGEIVGLAGLVGAGRSEIARALFGIDRYDSGRVRIAGHELRPGSVEHAKAARMALVPEDRQHEGLVLPMSVGENLTLTILSTLTRWGLLRRRAASHVVEQQMLDLSVKAAGPHIAAATLSGGNQQKLVLGKWLASAPQLLILDEPTRGVDVGAKGQVHRLIQSLADQGLATLVISSDMPELLSLSDRIMVIREGRVAGELDGATATPESVLALALPDAAGRGAS